MINRQETRLKQARSKSEKGAKQKTHKETRYEPKKRPKETDKWGLKHEKENSQIVHT